MIVKCIDNSHCEKNLKLNTEYPVEEVKGNIYKIVLGNGVIGNFLKTRFKEVN